MPVNPDATGDDDTVISSAFAALISNFATLVLGRIDQPGLANITQMGDTAAG